MGDTFASRVAASLLHAAGVPELVTRDPAAYFDLAKSLALDPARRASLRERLLASRATGALFDTPRFTADLERLLLAIWARHEAGSRDAVVLDTPGR